MAYRLGLNREKSQSYFDLLERIFMENELFDSHVFIFKENEIGLQFNNKVNFVL